MIEQRKKLLQELAAQNGTPLFVIDHGILNKDIRHLDKFGASAIL